MEKVPNLPRMESPRRKSMHNPPTGNITSCNTHQRSNLWNRCNERLRHSIEAQSIARKREFYLSLYDPTGYGRTFAQRAYGFPATNEPKKSPFHPCGSQQKWRRRATPIDQISYMNNHSVTSGDPSTHLRTFPLPPWLFAVVVVIPYDSSTQLCSTISRTRRLYSRRFSL